MASVVHKSLILRRTFTTALSSRSPLPSRVFLQPTQSCAHLLLTSTCSLTYFKPQFRFCTSRLSAVPDNASGGPRGPDGPNSGSGGGGGGGEGSGDGDKWSFMSWYLGLLAKYPVAVKAITSAILTLIGDLVCQRTSIFTLLGFVLVGPTLHFWYLYLSKLVTLPGASGVLLRLAIDQFAFAPTFIGVFLATLTTLEGRPSEVVPKLKQEWFSSVVANWQLWIPFQFLNFRFVPQQFQVLAANVISLVWNVILSFKAHKVLAK
ncbi:hypothetical protein PIB30_025337 [Stylosanthes scabra]|uniref:Uncharacterized protein n=1 Tax=Stylosanthes scabra TaxID=79078 RepID=A0ABU6XBI4_9FABA|nr:hypothetical protein [Stylosanthes scabra]